MEETLQELLITIQNIARDGITINSPISPISVFIDIITTLVATIVGGIVTLKLYKNQEQIRLKGELKIDYYKNYKNICLQILDLFSMYSSENNKILKRIKDDENGKLTILTDKVVCINEINMGFDEIKDIESLIKAESDIMKDIRFKSQSLKNFIELNKIIVDFSELKYSELNDKIREYNRKYKQLHFLFLKMIEVNNSISNSQLIDQYIEVFKELQKFNRKFQDEVIDIFKCIDQKIEEELIEDYCKNK